MGTTQLSDLFAICDNDVFKIVGESNCIIYLRKATTEEERWVLKSHNKEATGLTTEEHDQIKCTDGR